MITVDNFYGLLTQHFYTILIGFTSVAVIIATSVSVANYYDSSTFSSSSTASVYNAYAWQSTFDYATDYEYPETGFLLSKPNTAIAFTGGGSRAYVAALGYLAGLYQLNLLKNIRYIGGISGGSWATMVFSFAQNITSDDILLGPILGPETISQENLQIMDPRCARSLAAANFTLIALQARIDDVTGDIGDAWCYATAKVYLEPVGIKSGKKFSWSNDTIRSIIKRNPSLQAKDFQIPVLPNRPFPIIGTTLVGPSEGAPYKYSTQNFTQLEFTPLYVGQMKTNDVMYHYYSNDTFVGTMGGAVETFAFSRRGGAAPAKGLGKGKATDVLQIPIPAYSLDIQFAAGASSYAPGTLFESSPKNASQFGLHIDYWSPVDESPILKDTLFGDGGSFENINLISFLQRRVPKIVLFFDDSTPLQPASSWNPYTEPYTGDQVDSTLTCFFGVVPPNQSDIVLQTFNYGRDQVFPKSKFAPVITALQAAQAKGNGIIATFNLTTIENKWWGIPAGIESQITFVYLGRLSGWEAKLTSEMYPLLVPPGKNAKDLSVDINYGPYKNFPHYPTLGGDISWNRANVLADLTGWTILQNAALFESIFSNA
jgi:hypothetical protein